MGCSHEVAKSWTRLSDFTFTFHFHAFEKEMATHFSILAWRIPGTGGAWWAAIYGVAQSWTRLKRMAPHSSTLAWKIPWTEEPSGLQSMRSLRVGHD